MIPIMDERLFKTDKQPKTTKITNQHEMPCYVVDFDVLLDEIYTATTGKQAVAFGPIGDACVSKDMREKAGKSAWAKVKKIKSDLNVLMKACYLLSSDILKCKADDGTTCAPNSEDFDMADECQRIIKTLSRL